MTHSNIIGWILVVFVAVSSVACGSAAVQPQRPTYDQGILIPASEAGGISIIVSKAAFAKRASAQQTSIVGETVIDISEAADLDCSVEILDFDTLEVGETRGTLKEAVGYLEAHPRVEVIDETTYAVGPAGIFRLHDDCPVTREDILTSN